MRADSPIVFLVDDDLAVLEITARNLQRAELEVVTCESAQAFLDVYQPGQAGVLVLDIGMPGMNGLELQQLLVEREVLLPIIFVTGDASVSDTVQAFKAGAIDFLEKPYRSSLLISRIEAAIAEDGARRRHQAAQLAILERIGRLTNRERQVARLMVSTSSDVSSKEIARILGISFRTVEHHRAKVMEKMQARSLVDLTTMLHGTDSAALQ